MLANKQKALVDSSNGNQLKAPVFAFFGTHGRCPQNHRKDWSHSNLTKSTRLTDSSVAFAVNSQKCGQYIETTFLRNWPQTGSILLYKVCCVKFETYSNDIETSFKKRLA